MEGNIIITVFWIHVAVPLFIHICVWGCPPELFLLNNRCLSHQGFSLSWTLHAFQWVLLLFFSHFKTGSLWRDLPYKSFVNGNATRCWTNKVLFQLMIKLVIWCCQLPCIHPLILCRICLEIHWFRVLIVLPLTLVIWESCGLYPSLSF